MRTACCTIKTAATPETISPAPGSTPSNGSNPTVHRPTRIERSISHSNVSIHFKFLRLLPATARTHSPIDGRPGRGSGAYPPFRAASIESRSSPQLCFNVFSECWKDRLLVLAKRFESRHPASIRSISSLTSRPTEQAGTHTHHRSPAASAPVQYPCPWPDWAAVTPSAKQRTKFTLLQRGGLLIFDLQFVNHLPHVWN
jgi:hypothetical protein